MKALYKNSRLIAAAIVGTLALSAGAAVALTKDADHHAPQAELLGRFVVTPTTTTFVAPAEVMGRFVVTQRSSVFVPATA